MSSSLENISCIIVASGSGLGGLIETFESSVGVIFGDIKSKQLTNLPKETVTPSMVLHDGAILLCGGFYNQQKCVQLDHGAWKEHS